MKYIPRTEVILKVFIIHIGLLGMGSTVKYSPLAKGVPAGKGQRNYRGGRAIFYFICQVLKFINIIIPSAISSEMGQGSIPKK